jgi:hypothetical protein
MKPPKTLINFIIEESLLERIEDFRFKNRFATRAAAIKWLLDWSLKQKPAVKNITEDAKPVPMPVEFPVQKPAVEPVKPERAALPSRASMIQALRDQGYEVGEAVHHSEGRERILVRSQNGSAWVSDGEELQDLAAARTTLVELAARRAAGR